MVRMLFGGLIALLAAGTAPAGATDYFSELVKDFGTTPRGPMLVHYFSVTNKSAQPVTIGTPRVSCGCVSASVLNPQLAPGQSTAVVAYMDTNRIPTPGVTKSVIVYVPFLSPVHEEVQLRVQTVTRTDLEAMGGADHTWLERWRAADKAAAAAIAGALPRTDLMISPDTLSLGTVRKGQTGTVTTKVTYLSDPNWKITAATSTGVYLKPTLKPANAPAAAGSTYELTVTLDPACPVGNWTADIFLTTTGAGLEKLRVPVTVTVTPAITVNPQAVAFGDVTVGKPVEKQVMVQSPEPFSVKEIKKGGAGLDVTALAAGPRPTHLFKLSFTPTTAGPVKSAFEILTDSKEQPTVTVPWTANVVK